MRSTTLSVLLALVLSVQVSPARAGAPGEAALVRRARSMLKQGPRVSPALARSARQLIRGASLQGKGQLFHYAPLVTGRSVTLFDSRRIPGGFASSSLTVRPAAPRSGNWDVRLIREDSSRRSLKDVARVAKQLPGGKVLELHYVAPARGKASGTYSLFDPAGRLLGGGSVDRLRTNRQTQATLGIPARQLSALFADFAPFGS